MLQKYDYIVVGQGIIGTILTFKLMQLGKSVLVIDDHHKDSSSHIAAGIINPITGRNYVKTWKLESLLPELVSTYSDIATLLNNDYLIDRNVVRVLHSAKEENAWMQRTGDNSYIPFMSDTITNQSPNEHLTSEGTYGLIKNGYQLRISQLVSDFNKYIVDLGIIDNSRFDFNDLAVTDHIQYKEYSADRIIFCEGFQVRDNPLFNYLPFDPVKGQVLIIEAQELQLNDNYRDQIFVTPLGNDQYWIGAGYDKGFTHLRPTLDEKDRLTKVLDTIVTCPYKLVKHIAGIRPAFKTRKPVIGAHPHFDNVYVCNGMGAKGSSLGPYFSQQLINSIENGGAIDSEVDINRYKI